MCMEDINIQRAKRYRAHRCAEENTIALRADPDRIAIRLVPETNATVTLWQNVPNQSNGGAAVQCNLANLIPSSSGIGEGYYRPPAVTITLDDVGDLLNGPLNVSSTTTGCIVIEVYLPPNAGPSMDISKLPK